MGLEDVSLQGISEDLSFNYYFGPIIGKFSPGANVILSSCSLLEQGTVPEKMTAMISLAKKLKLPVGATLYMNETPGGDYSKVSEIILEAKKPLPSAGLVEQTLNSLSAPVDLMRHLIYKSAGVGNAINKVLNQGYTLKMTDLDTYVLFKDDYFNALESKPPSGERLLGSINGVPFPFPEPDDSCGK